MDLEGHVDAAARKALAAGTYMGFAIGIVQAGRKRTFGYGRIAASTGGTPDGQSIFEIGSITKVFTATLLACLKEEGLVCLDDPVRKHLPDDVKVASRNGKIIRLHHLATHTSGLPRLPNNLSTGDPTNPYADYTDKDLYTFVAKARLVRDPGDSYEYSNVGGGLLGHVLARRAGTSYEELVRSRISDPLGMKDTCISPSAEQKPRFVPGHDARGKEVPYWDVPALAGAGALRSTVNDLLRFLEANLSEAPEPPREAMRL